MQARDHQFCATLTDEERQVSWKGVSNFLFLELSLACKLVTCALILVHVMGMQSSNKELPVFALRIFYYLSVVFFYVACSLNIYEWLLILQRVNFFGGKISRHDYQVRSRVNKVVYSLVASLVGLANVVIIFVNAFDPHRETSLALMMTITLVFCAMLVTFTAVGSVLIHKLRAFFKSNYDKQRVSILTALICLIISLLVLSVRYGLEYAYLDQHLSERQSTRFPLLPAIALLAISDFGPIIAQVYCMRLANKGDWNDLLSGFLEAPFADDTVAGSVILDELQHELRNGRLRSELLDQTDNSSMHGAESAKAEVVGTARIIRSGTEIRDELARCDQEDQLKQERT